MPDVIPAPTPTPTTDQTSPLDAGHTTTEFYVAKLVTILSGVSVALGFAMNLAEKAQILLPSAGWLNTAMVVGGITATVLAQVIYTLSRVRLKEKALVIETTKPVVPVGPGTVQDKAVATLDAI